MIREKVRVVSHCNGQLRVRYSARSGCQRCASGKGCGGAYLARLVGEPVNELVVQCETPLAVGEEVEMAIDESRVLHGAALAYLLPLTGLVIGTMGGQVWGEEAGAVAGAVGGLVVGWLVARRLVKATHRLLQPTAYIH